VRATPRRDDIVSEATAVARRLHGSSSPDARRRPPFAVARGVVGEPLTPADAPPRVTCYHEPMVMDVCGAEAA